MKKFIIIQSQSLYELEEIVCSKLDDGYVLHGSIFMSPEKQPNYGRRYTEYYQAMVLPSPPQQEDKKGE